MPMTDYMRTLIANAITSGRLALFTESPSATSAGVEVSGGSYSRATVTISAVSGNPSLLHNTGDANFTNLPEVTVAAVGLFNSAGTQLLYYAPVTPPKSFESGDSATILAGSFSIELT